MPFERLATSSSDGLPFQNEIWNASPLARHLTTWHRKPSRDSHHLYYCCGVDIYHGDTEGLTWSSLCFLLGKNIQTMKAIGCQSFVSQ